MSLLGNLTAAVTILGHHLEAAIQRLQIRNSQIRGRSLGKSQGEIRLNCLNCPELTWVETTDNLMEAASGGVVGVPLDAQQLLKIAETLQTTNALSLIEIVEGLDLDSACDDRFLARVSEQLLVNMPVMSVSKGGFIVIVNMHEFLFSGQRDSFADLLLLDTPVDSEADNKEDTEGEEPQVVHHVHLKPGRKPLSEQFPEIVTLVTDYVQLHGFSAQSRRRSQVEYSFIDRKLWSYVCHLMLHSSVHTGNTFCGDYKWFHLPQNWMIIPCAVHMFDSGISVPPCRWWWRKDKTHYSVICSSWKQISHFSADIDRIKS